MLLAQTYLRIYLEAYVLLGILLPVLLLEIFNFIKKNIFFHGIKNFYGCIRDYYFFFFFLIEVCSLPPHTIYLTRKNTTRVTTSSVIETATCAAADVITSAATKTAISRVETVNFPLVLITVFFHLFLFSKKLLD